MKIEKHDFPLIAAFALFLFGVIVIGTSLAFEAVDREQEYYELQLEEIENETLPFMQ